MAVPEPLYSALVSEGLEVGWTRERTSSVHSSADDPLSTISSISERTSLSSVHSPHQVLPEGLAQAFPMFVALDDDALITPVSVDHYIQLIRLCGLTDRVRGGLGIDRALSLAEISCNGASLPDS